MSVRPRPLLRRAALSLLLTSALAAATAVRAGPPDAQVVPDEIVREAIATLQDPGSPEDAQDAARVVARAGRRALPLVDAALVDASWHARAALIGAVAEMDDADASALLAPAAQDGSFAVREAAVVGLGKIAKDRAAALLLLDRCDPEKEPVWRVRAAAAEAVRRAALRGMLPRDLAEAALVAQLQDPDPDARRAALRAVVPLGAEGALPLLLALYDDRESDPVDRSLALAALRLYRDRAEQVLPTLRRGLLETDDAEQAAAAGAALLDLGGVAVLEDEEVARAVLRQLGDAGAPALRSALGRLGPEAVPWLTRSARDIAHRIAQRRVEHQGSPLELVVEALLEIRREAAFEFLAEVAVGPEAEVMAPATRRFALRKIQLLFAPRLAAELRAAFDGHAGDGVRRALLLAIEASGGDDLAARLDAALEHPDSEARWAAIDLLKRRPDLPAGPVLSRLAADPETPGRLREHALEALARRDAAAAAVIARGLLLHGHADVRETAAALIAGAARPDDAALLRERLAAEDGSDSREASAENADASVTPSSPHVDRDRRRRVRRSLLSALAACAGADARGDLFAVLRDEEDSVLRETAARLLRGMVHDGDDADLLALLDAEEDAAVQRELLATLATLGGSDAVRERFEALLQASGRRWDALVLLRSDDAKVRPTGLEKALDDDEWNDEEREVALVLLERQGRTPAPERLVRLVREARSKSLAVEALRLVAETAGEQAGPLLSNLLHGTEDPEKIALAVEQIGRLRFEPAVPALIELLDAWRRPALRATLSSEPPLEVYRRAAVALGRCGTPAAGEALARHLLDPAVARATLPYSTTGNGPFKPAGAPPVRAVRALVSALAHFDEPTARALVQARMDALAATAADMRLPEEYVDGVARYLRDPGAYDLPERRRPAAALPLMEHVLHTAPRMSALDVETTRLVAEQLEAEGRYDEALAAHAVASEIADIEEAWRSPEQRLEERGKSELLHALALSARGDRDGASAVLDALREPDPNNGALAYYQGYGRAKIGLPDQQAREALRQAVIVDEAHARAHLWLGWVTESLDGTAASLGHYAEALRLDRKRVRDAGGQYLTHRRGKVHRWSAYPYWYARALARAGDDATAADLLHEAIARDDRTADQALADPAFEGWDDLGELVAWARSSIPDSE